MSRGAVWRVEEYTRFAGVRIKRGAGVSGGQGRLAARACRYDVGRPRWGGCPLAGETGRMAELADARDLKSREG